MNRKSIYSPDIDAALDAEAIDRFGVMFADLDAGQRRLVLDVVGATR